MIVSRTAELARLDALLAALVRGEGGALVVHGEAGIGKTTLLEALIQRCGNVVTVVRACGAETEAELAFSALADLLGPVLCQLDALPVQQAAALTGALALGPPEPGDRLARVPARAGRSASARIRLPGRRARRAGQAGAAGRRGARRGRVACDRGRVPAGRTTARHLADAETAGLVRLAEGRVTFAHPLIRGQVYREARAADRRVAHVALAAVLPEDDDRRAWHLAAAAVAPDEAVAATLERVGGQAMARRAYAAGSDALERAARLSPEPAAAGRRMITAGQAAAAAGVADRALALFAEAAELTCGEEQRARAQQLRGRLQVWRGRPAEATPLLVSHADRVASRWPVLAAEMLADAANGATAINSYLEAERLAQRAVGLLGDAGDPAVRGAVLTMRGWTLVLRGEAPEARPVLAEALRLAAGLDRLGPDWPWLHILLRTRIPLGEFEQARAENAELCRRAQDAGALATVARPGCSWPMPRSASATGRLPMPRPGRPSNSRRTSAIATWRAGR